MRTVHIHALFTNFLAPPATLGSVIRLPLPEPRTLNTKPLKLVHGRRGASAVTVYGHIHGMTSLCMVKHTLCSPDNNSEQFPTTRPPTRWDVYNNQPPCARHPVQCPEIILRRGAHFNSTLDLRRHPRKYADGFIDEAPAVRGLHYFSRC